MCRLQAMGIRDKPIAAGSPWQNGYAERLIGSIRRECSDHVIALRTEHLRRVLLSYARYYNIWPTHRSLDKDAPVSWSTKRLGVIMSWPVLGGLHHRYCRI
jgi:transposase InsO family protein